MCFKLWPRSNLKVAKCWQSWTAFTCLDVLYWSLIENSWLARCWKSHFMFMPPSIHCNDQMDHQLVYHSFSLSSLGLQFYKGFATIIQWTNQPVGLLDTHTGFLQLVHSDSFAFQFQKVSLFQSLERAF